MGTLFPNDDEYPDYVPMPRFPARLGVNGAVVPLAIAGTMFGLCPIVLEDHAHAPHQEHATDFGYTPMGSGAVSSTSPNSSVTVRLDGVQGSSALGRLTPDFRLP